MPYGITIMPDGLTLRVFNREYGQFAGFRLRRRLSDAALRKMCHGGSPGSASDGFQKNDDGSVWVFFYDDGCIPWRDDSRATTAYLERLSRFAKLKVDTRSGAPRPYPDHCGLPIDEETKA